MKFFIAFAIVLGVWQCSIANVAASPVGECPLVDGEYPVLLPDSVNRSIFYICSGGVPFAIPCPDGLEYDDAIKSCNYPQTLSPIGECPPVDGDRPTFLPDSENKTIYYECVGGTPILMVCPPGLEFNPKLDVCDWPTLVNEPIGKCPEEDKGVVTILADEEDCSKYYVCFGGRPFTSTCPEGLLFNPERNYCDFPGNFQCNKGKGDERDEETEDQ